MNKLYLLLFAFIAQVFALNRCKNGISDKNGDFELDLLSIEPIVGDEYRIKFSGTAMKKLLNPVVELDFSILGIQIENKRHSLCPDRPKRLSTSWLRTSTDESSECSFSKGEQIIGSVLVSLPSRIIEGLDTSVSFTLANTCVSDEVFIHPTSPILFSSDKRRFGFSDEEIDYLFAAWLMQHQDTAFLPEKLYSSSIHQPTVLHERKEIFKENLINIALHNHDERHSYKLAMNQFGHLKFDEFKNIYASSLRPELSSRQKNYEASNYKKFTEDDRLPLEVNWVEKGAVTEVKNQGACGSCWSFAATGALEGAYFLKTGQLKSFSEQELVACDHVDLGCNGGAMDNAWQFIENNHGICTETDYPYTAGEGVRGFCATSCAPVADSTPVNIVDVLHDERSLEVAVANQPVAVAIEADEPAFQFYSSGVLTAQCSQKLDHGVLVVGYGTDEETNVDYWLVKNSWGPMWGLGGYIKLQRGTQEALGGECGILLGPSFPEL